MMLKISPSLMYQNSDDLKTRELRASKSNPLDSCQFVFLDMGSNFGVQIRKLFEPNLYPDAIVLTLFEKYFGPVGTRNISEFCAVGWEPNPKHEVYLQKMTEAYNSCGYRILVHTKTGVGASNRVSQLIETVNDPRDWGAAIVDGSSLETDKNHKIHDITIIRIAEYINEIVGKRRIDMKRPSSVVMKLDVEGLEIEILADLIHSGAIKHLDNVHIEFHPNLSEDFAIFRDNILSINKVIENMKINLSRYTDLSLLDDESYGAFHELKPFPEC